jgi:Methyltransferase domain
MTSLARLIAERVSVRNREHKLQAFLRAFRPDASMSVLDVGYSDHEYTPAENYFEKHYRWPARVTALGIDEPRECPQKYPEISFVQYGGALFPFERDSFDVACSNAVIEHVGPRASQSRFVAEMVRAAPLVWITTPSRAFPVDTHTLIPFAHWLPRRTRDFIYRLLGKEWATGDAINLLYKRDLRKLLATTGAGDVEITTNRLLLWPLDYVAVIRRPGPGRAD